MNLVNIYTVREIDGIGATGKYKYFKSRENAIEYESKEPAFRKTLECTAYEIDGELFFHPVKMQIEDIDKGESYDH